MSVRYNVELPDNLDSKIEAAAKETNTSKSEILRKAIILFLEARAGNRKGLKVGLVEPDTEKLKTEFIGL